MINYKPYCSHKPRKKKAYDYWSKLKKQDRSIQKYNAYNFLCRPDKSKIAVRITDIIVLAFAGINIRKTVILLKNSDMSFIEIFVYGGIMSYFMLAALGWFVAKIIWKTTGIFAAKIRNFRK